MPPTYKFSVRGAIPPSLAARLAQLQGFAIKQAASGATRQAAQEVLDNGKQRSDL